MFGIKRKDTGEFFQGFNDDYSVIWTSDKNEAWRGDLLSAKCQSSLFIKENMPVQRKPVSFNLSRNV